jgi:hypothetical protein
VAAAVLTLGTVGGVTVAIGFDNTTGAHTSIQITNPTGKPVKVVAGPMGKAQSTAQVSTSSAITVGGTQPVFALVSKLPTDVTASISVT